MISHKDIPEMIRKCEIIAFVIKNMDGYKMFDHRGHSPQAAVVAWNDMVKYLIHNKHIVVEAGNKDMGKGKGIAKFTWEIFIDVAGPGNNQPTNYGGAMYGPDMNHPLLQMKLKELELENKIKNLEEKKGGGDSDDKWINVLSGLLPEIFKKEPGSTLHGPDDLKTGQEEMVSKLEALMGEVCKKVSMKKIILLLEAIKKNPKLVDKALNFLE